MNWIKVEGIPSLPTNSAPVLATRPRYMSHVEIMCCIWTRDGRRLWVDSKGGELYDLERYPIEYWMPIPISPPKE